MVKGPKLYRELAPWFHLLTAPKDYEEEAAAYARLLAQEHGDPLRTVLELGSGGGNNASHLKHRFAMTLVDLSPAMLETSRALNPECEHVEGDMRTVRLDRVFDAVFIHDAISYLTSEDDLAAAMATARAHLRPGGAALFAPDFVRETFSEREGNGGHDDGDRRLRYVERFVDADPTDTIYECLFDIALHERGRIRRVEDRHVLGLFPRATWIRLAQQAGFEDVRWEHSSAGESPSGGGDVLVGRAASGNPSRA